MVKDKIIYSLSIDDIYEVANQEVDRDLTDEEVLAISDKVAEFIDWYQAIQFAMQDCGIYGDEEINNINE